MTDVRYIEKYGLWFPWNESRPDKMYSALMKYERDNDFMLSLLPAKRRKRTCIQAGGHIGVVPLRLAGYFGKVITFEPDPPVFEALALNVRGVPNITVHNAALGEVEGTKKLSYYSGRTAVSTMAEIRNAGDLLADVRVMTIDSLDEPVSAIVLDIEGYEPWALRGARGTIAKHRPVIICEMLPRAAQEITATLASMEYFPVDNPINRKCRDVVFTHKGLV